MGDKSLDSHSNCKAGWIRQAGLLLLVLICVSVAGGGHEVALADVVAEAKPNATFLIEDILVFDDPPDKQTVPFISQPGILLVGDCLRSFDDMAEATPGSYKERAFYDSWMPINALSIKPFHDLYVYEASYDFGGSPSRVIQTQADTWNFVRPKIIHLPLLWIQVCAFSCFDGMLGGLQRKPHILGLLQHREELEYGNYSKNTGKPNNPPILKRFLLLLVCGVGGFFLSDWGSAARNRSGWRGRIALPCHIAGIGLFVSAALLYFLTDFSWSWGWWL